MIPEEVLKQEYSKLIGNPDKVYAQNPSIIQAAHSAIKIYALQARIQERKDCIYVLESSMIDSNWSKTYKQCMKDEITIHNTFIQDLEKELATLTK